MPKRRLISAANLSYPVSTTTHIRGRPQRYIELSEVTSIEEIQQLIAAKIEEIGEGEWITGYGWSEDELDEGRRLLRVDLDAVAPNNPVILTRAGGLSAVTNSLALQLADYSGHPAARRRSD